MVIWLLFTMSPLGAKDAIGAGATLVATTFGCVSNVVGINVMRGGRHLALNLAGCFLVLMLYLGIAALF